MPRKLMAWEEVVGTIDRVVRYDKWTHIVVSGQEVIIPTGLDVNEDEKEVAIIRTDQTYHVQEDIQ